MSKMISVILPAYNEEKTIGQCLQALRESDFTGKCEIIVGNNNSTDKTRKIALKLADKVVDVKEQGIAHARNGAIRASRGDIIACVDSDCIVDKGWLSSIAKAFEDPKLVGMTGPIYPLTDSIKHKLMFRAIWTGLSRLLLALRMPAFPGNNCAYRGKQMFEVGLFNTEVCPGEDIELSQRMRRLGSFRFVPGATVYTAPRRYEEDGWVKEIIKWFHVATLLPRTKTWKKAYRDIR